MTAARAHRLLVWYALGLMLVIVAASLWLHGPQVEADEGSYLLSAAALAGKLRHAVALGPYSGYSFLLTPAFLLWPDPVHSFHVVLVINALLVASIPFALYRMLRLLRPDLDPRWPLVAAITATCYGPTLTLSQYAMSDNALVPLYAWLLTCVATALSRPRVLPAIAAGAFAGALMLVHPRGAMIALPVLAVFSVSAVRRRELRLAAGAMWLVMLAVAALHAPLEHMAGKSESIVGVYAPAATFARFTMRSTWLWIATNLIGATTTAIVTSLGILVLTVRVFLDSMRFVHVKDLLALPQQTTVMLASILGMTAALVTTAVFVATPTRADQIVYGRYTLPTLVPLIAIGLLRFAACPKDRVRDARWAIGAGFVGIALMAAAFLRVPHAIASTWVFINAVVLDLARYALPTGNTWLSIGLCFAAAAVLLYATSRRSGFAAMIVFLCFNLGVALSGWLFVTRPLSVVYGNRPVVAAASGFERLTGTPLCVRLEGLDAWNMTDISWRLFPQIGASSLIDRNRCINGVIMPLQGKAPGNFHLIAMERPSPLNKGPIGLFVEPGQALAAYASERDLPAADALAPLPVADRSASIEIAKPEVPIRVVVGNIWKATVHITNRGHSRWTPTTTTYLPFPIRLGAQVVPDAAATPTVEYRSELPDALKPGDTEAAMLKIGPFNHRGCYRVHIGVVQEHVAWFDGAIDIEINVVER